MAFECLSLYREYREMVLMNLFAGSNGDTSSFTGKESACNAGDPSSIPELGRSPGEGIGYSVQYFGAFLVAQMVKNPPAMWETWI